MIFLSDNMYEHRKLKEQGVTKFKLLEDIIQ
jgi:hypothetical protein